RNGRQHRLHASRMNVIGSKHARAVAVGVLHLATSGTAGRAHTDLRHASDPRLGAGPAQGARVAARNASDLGAPVEMRVDVQDVNGFADDVQRVKHRDRDAMISADDKYLCPLTPELPQ